MFWTKVNEVQYLDNCNCATTASNTDIDLSNPPTSIDGVTLEKNYRILVKNQDSNKEQNGIYVLTDTKNKIWQRSSDLNSSEKLVPQLSTQITSGSSNGSKIYRIVLPVPNTITNIQATSYTLETTDIEWNEVSASGLFNSSPETWQKIGTGTSNTFNLGSYSMDSSTISSSKRIGIAIKVPSTSTLSNNLITENGKVRNIRFKVEYKTKED
jgi:parallel beta-helix repeat protein